MTALQRARRKLLVLGYQSDLALLAGSPAFRAHVARGTQRDPLFFVSHRHYLAKGLTAWQRLDAAVCHYRHEDTRFGPGYGVQVYQGGGLKLWEKTVAGVRYDIRLSQGNDVLYEGGLSIVLHVDDGRVCVLTFSVVPTTLVMPDLAPEQDAAIGQKIIFVTRKQLTPVRDYQTAFNAAFDRCTPAHLCFAALSGLALAQGFHCAFGIAPDRHPSFAPELSGQFQTAYSDFWLSLSGRKLSSLGYLIDLPMQLTPIDLLSGNRRKRALVRRAHGEQVLADTLERLTPHLRNPV